MNDHDHPLWQDFWTWARAAKVFDDDEAEWRPYWEAFLAGVKAGHEYVVNPRNPATGSKVRKV